MTELELKKIAAHKSSPLKIMFNNSRGTISVKEFDFTVIGDIAIFYDYQIEYILGKINNDYCNGKII